MNMRSLRSSKQIPYSKFLYSHFSLTMITHSDDMGWHGFERPQCVNNLELLPFLHMPFKYNFMNVCRLTDVWYVALIWEKINKQKEVMIRYCYLARCLDEKQITVFACSSAYDRLSGMGSIVFIWNKMAVCFPIEISSKSHHTFFCCIQYL